MSADAPAIDFGLNVDAVRLRINWRSRRVKIVSFDACQNTYFVGCGRGVWQLEGATSALGQAGELIGKEIQLQADCFLQLRRFHNSPEFILRYKSHLLQLLSNTVQQIETRCALCATDDQGCVLLLKERNTDFILWKRTLRRFCELVHNFRHFQEEIQRRKDRHQLNTLRSGLLDAEKWRLHAW